MVKKFIVAIFIFAMLSVSFYVVLICQKNSLVLKNKYPMLSCTDTFNSFKAKPEEFSKLAIEEYQYNKNLESKGEMTNYKQMLQCFCKNEEQRGVSKFMEYTLQKGDITEFSGRLCFEYSTDNWISLVLSKSIAFFIVAVNIFLKEAIVEMSKWIGESTVSKEQAVTVNAVFLAQFINTGLLILIVNANLQEHFPKDSMM